MRTSSVLILSCLFFFFFNDTATTEIYPLSLHDALPISVVTAARDHVTPGVRARGSHGARRGIRAVLAEADHLRDRKSTRLNSSHSQISYAVFCLKKKKGSFRVGIVSQRQLA